MKDEKTVFLVEKIPGFDMRLKLHGDPVEIVQMIQGAMTVEPALVGLFKCAVETLPVFQACVGTSISKDFTGKKQQ